MPNEKPVADVAGGAHSIKLDLLWSAPARERSASLDWPSRRRCITCRIAAGALMLAAGCAGRAVSAEILRLDCTNPVSGTSFPIVVDLDHDRVGTLAATITRQWISWHDPQQGFFDLDRRTGKLRLRNASSTGGYFLNYACRSEQ